MGFSEKINKVINEEWLERIRKETIVIGVSGGPDSIYLLNWLLTKTNNIIVCSVNYNLRKESKKEFDYVKSIAQKNDLGFEGASHTDKPDANIQDWARRMRNKLFVETLEKYDSKILLLGQHMDDVIESYFMNQQKKSKAPVFKAITNFEKDLWKIRPLYYLNKEEILKTLSEKKIKYFIDRSNLKENYLRNKIRRNIFLSVDEKETITKQIVNKNIQLDREDIWISYTLSKVTFPKGYLVSKILSLSEEEQEKVVRLILKKEIRNERSLGNKVTGLTTFLRAKNYSKKFRVQEDKYAFVEKGYLKFLLN